MLLQELSQILVIVRVSTSQEEDIFAAIKNKFISPQDSKDCIGKTEESWIIFDKERPKK